MLDFIVKKYQDKEDRHLLEVILANQHLIISKLFQMDDQFSQFSAALDKLDSDIQTVSDNIKNIVTGVPAGNLTADQVSSLLARITGEQQKLEAIQIPATGSGSGDTTGATS